eukprot:jgi/Botrbrau1/19066/Bobra.0795s0003.1
MGQIPKSLGQLPTPQSLFQQGLQNLNNIEITINNNQFSPNSNLFGLTNLSFLPNISQFLPNTAQISQPIFPVPPSPILPLVAAAPILPQNFSVLGNVTINANLLPLPLDVLGLTAPLVTLPVLQYPATILKVALAASHLVDYLNGTEPSVKDFKLKAVGSRPPACG